MTEQVLVIACHSKVKGSLRIEPRQIDAVYGTQALGSERSVGRGEHADAVG